MCGKDISNNHASPHSNQKLGIKSLIHIISKRENLSLNKICYPQIRPILSLININLLRASN